MKEEEENNRSNSNSSSSTNINVYRSKTKRVQSNCLYNFSVYQYGAHFMHWIFVTMFEMKNTNRTNVAFAFFFHAIYFSSRWDAQLFNEMAKINHWTLCVCACFFAPTWRSINCCVKWACILRLKWLFFINLNSCVRTDFVHTALDRSENNWKAINRAPVCRINEVNYRLNENKKWLFFRSYKNHFVCERIQSQGIQIAKDTTRLNKKKSMTTSATNARSQGWIRPQVKTHHLIFQFSIWACNSAIRQIYSFPWLSSNLCNRSWLGYPPLCIRT